MRSHRYKVLCMVAGWFSSDDHGVDDDDDDDDDDHSDVVDDLLRYDVSWYELGSQ